MVERLRPDPQFDNSHFSSNAAPFGVDSGAHETRADTVFAEDIP